MMRPQISQLETLGPLPSASAPEAVIAQHEEVLHSIRRPVTDEEAAALSRLFGPDDCHGLAWTLLHLIETSPGWPLDDVLRVSDNEWIARLRQRARS